ncbi:MAG TPA: hypothetical protein VNH18_03930, partial [Bryobacteraceae bacterium]|nr:hypothetical protein [Bryobacteraceae bacterium]
VTVLKLTLSWHLGSLNPVATHVVSVAKTRICLVNNGCSDRQARDRHIEISRQVIPLHLAGRKGGSQ